MKHLGDITKLKGSEVPLTEIVVGGSPCQDLSVAGKRAGLAGARSGLFMEQIRLIKEMRENDRKNGRTDEHIRPRYMVWENVPGAFSSNKGEDFRAVLEETAKVAEGDACIPRLEKWPHAGCIMGDGWSLAWRLHDAQFWGVPQRRKRIALVADFGGATAPEILFERKGMRRDPEESGETREGAAADAQGSTGKAISGGGDSAPKVVAFTQNQRNEVRNLGEKAGALAAERGAHQQTNVLEGNGSRPSHKGDGYAESETMYTLNSTEHHAVAYRKTSHAKSAEDGQGWAETEVNDTLNAFDNGESRTPTVVVAPHITPKIDTNGVAFTLNERDYKDAQAVCIENHPADSRVKISEDGMVQTLSSSMGTGGGNVPMVMEEPYNATTGSFMRAGNSGIAETLAARDYKDPRIVCNSVVRRLTPLECERLQGYPDGWTDIGEWYDSKGKKHKDADSPRYKALGNSIALPFWEWMAKRMVQHLDTDKPTMASLFDGIGGFPLVYSRAGCEPVWASEIEEFPIAVTKIRFSEENK